MRSKDFLILIFCFTLLLAISTGGQTRNDIKDTRIENLKKTVAELRDAYEAQDLPKIADFFASKAIDDVGGRDKFVEWLALGNSASRPGAALFANPLELSLIDEKWLSVVPYRMERMITAKNHKVIRTCLVAVSLDDGRTWRFHTGESIYDVYPELRGIFQIIERKETIEDIER
jgi:hypothetical protein